MKNLTILGLFLLLVPSAPAQDMPLSQILIPGEGWAKGAAGFKPISGIIAHRFDPNELMVFDTEGHMQGFVDGMGKKIDRKIEEKISFRPGMIAPGGDFQYRILDNRKSLGIFSAKVPQEKIAEIPLEVEEAVFSITADRGTMLIADAASKYVWAYRIDKDGKLSGGERYMTLRVRKEEPRSEASAIRVDKAGRIYVASKLGVQVFDPTGRLCGVLTNPSTERITAMTFGGPKGDHLVVACGTVIYSRRLNAVWGFFNDKK